MIISYGVLPQLRTSHVILQNEFVASKYETSGRKKSGIWTQSDQKQQTFWNFGPTHDHWPISNLGPSLKKQFGLAGPWIFSRVLEKSSTFIQSVNLWSVVQAVDPHVPTQVHRGTCFTWPLKSENRLFRSRDWF